MQICCRVTAWTPSLYSATAAKCRENSFPPCRAMSELSQACHLITARRSTHGCSAGVSVLLGGNKGATNHKRLVHEPCFAQASPVRSTKQVGDGKVPTNFDAHPGSLALLTATITPYKGPAIFAPLDPTQSASLHTLLE